MRSVKANVEILKNEDTTVKISFIRVQLFTEFTKTTAGVAGDLVAVSNGVVTPTSVRKH